MTALLDKASKVAAICPTCGTEWEKVSFPTDSYYMSGDIISRRYPVRENCCRACAIESAAPNDFIKYVEHFDLICDFFGWLLGVNISRCQSSELQSIWTALLEHDPTRLKRKLREFVEAEEETNFFVWKGGFLHAHDH